MAPLVGALPEEVAVMQTLTANLHLMMASFYRPNKEKYKIVLEGKAFPSDHVGTSATLIASGASLLMDGLAVRCGIANSSSWP